MKNIHSVILATLLLSTTVNANEQENKLGVNIGVTSIYNEDSIELDNLSAGVTYQFNEVNSDIKPRIDLDYVNISDYKDVTSFVKVSANGVYEFMEGEVVSPYIMAGIGYEVVNSEINDELDSRAFAQGGVGAVYHQGNDFDVNIEGKVLQTFGNDRQDNEVIVTAGVAIPVGTLFKGGIAQDECPVKIAGADEDRDGVTDAVDQCPNTPCYFTVDDLGCPIKATLRIHFDVDKATIRPHSMSKVESFAEFLVANKGSNVKIDGHTDSDADDAYNMILSDKRANAVMNKLVALGVSANRLTAEGKGESMPVASNATISGKSLNRRIEVTLTYPQK
jgi:OOP family OmpA-OmpF porin